MKQNERSGIFDYQKIVEIPYGDISTVCVLGAAKIAVGFTSGYIRTFQLAFDRPSTKFYFQISNLNHNYQTLLKTKHIFHLFF